MGESISYSFEAHTKPIIFLCRTWNRIRGIPRRHCSDARSFSLGCVVFLYAVHYRTWKPGKDMTSLTRQHRSLETTVFTRVLLFRIGNFRVGVNLIMKARLSAKLFISHFHHNEFCLHMNEN